MQNLIKFYYKIIRLLSSHDKRPRILNNGLPQESILSPLLFNLYTYGICYINNLEIIQYADDFCQFLKESSSKDDFKPSIGKYFSLHFVCLAYLLLGSDTVAF